ncbi:MAG: hypothetical protein ACK5CL_03235 [Sphingomonadales bacterium]|jgi:hypothetical protein
MENIICGHCGTLGLVLNLHGCYHCSVCKCVIFQEQDVQDQDVFDEEHCETEFVSRVTFHTDNHRYSVGFASGV